MGIGTTSYSREDDREGFLESLRDDGFKLVRKNGEEVFLKAVQAQFSYSIAGSEVLFIEIDGSLDEESLR